MWLDLYWTGPIRVGAFLVCLGGMIYLIGKADEKTITPVDWLPESLLPVLRSEPKANNLTFAQDKLRVATSRTAPGLSETVL